MAGPEAFRGEAPVSRTWKEYSYRLARVRQMQDQSPEEYRLVRHSWTAGVSDGGRRT